MFRSARSGGFQGESYALRILTKNTLSSLTDRTSTYTAIMDSVLSIMAIGWAPSLATAVGVNQSNDVLKYARQGVLDAPTYRPTDDMIVRASGEKIPLGRTQWRIRLQLLTRFHLSDVADIKSRGALISRFGSRGIRPRCVSNGPHTHN